MNVFRKAFARKRLLRLLHVAAVMPLALMFLLSLFTALRQELLLHGKISEHVFNLAKHVAESRNGKHPVHPVFLEDTSEGDDATGAFSRASGDIPPIVPERAALFSAKGELLWASPGGESLRAFLETPPKKIVRIHEEFYGESVLCLYPADDPGVVAIAAVSFDAWVEGKGILAPDFAIYAFVTALLCLLLICLQKRWLLSPLQCLVEEIRSLHWGIDIPRKAIPPQGRFHLEVEEILELRQALTELAQQAVEKEALQRRYVGDLVKTQENERRRVAREIHDGPIQIVAALVQHIQMALLARNVQRTEEHLILAEEIARHAVDDLRSICDELSPPWLSLGLARCLEELAERLSRQYAVSVETHVHLRAELDPERTLAVFRICQEGVSNAVRHGAAATVTIRVAERKERNEIRLLVRDDGGGFAPSVDLDRFRSEGRRGLAGIKERTEFLGGRLKVRSSPGKGTLLDVSLPLKT